MGYINYEKLLKQFTPRCWYSENELMVKFKLSKKALDELIEPLLDAKILKMKHMPTPGRSRFTERYFQLIYTVQDALKLIRNLPLQQRLKNT